MAQHQGEQRAAPAFGYQAKVHEWKSETLQEKACRAIQSPMPRRRQKVTNIVTSAKTVTAAGNVNDCDCIVLITLLSTTTSCIFMNKFLGAPTSVG